MRRASWSWNSPWGVRLDPMNLAGDASGTRAFGASASADGQIKGGKVNRAVPKAKALADADILVNSHALASVHFWRPFTIKGAPGGCVFVLNGVLQGQLYANNPDLNTKACVQTAYKIVEGSYNNYKFNARALAHIGFGLPVDGKWVYNKNITVNIPDSTKVILTDGIYTVMGVLITRAEVDSATVSAGNAISDFFNTMDIDIAGSPIIRRVDVGSLSLGLCSHVNEELKVTVDFSHSMNMDVPPAIELEHRPGAWTTLEPKNIFWSEALVGMPASRYEVFFNLPHLPDQTVLRPRFRVSCAQLSDVTGKMTPYLKETALSYLILKDKDTNWITLSKDVYNPGEHIEGRYNRVLKDGSCILALYRKGASDFLGFRYARMCSTVGWAAPDVPGEYELRLLQKINEDKKIRYVNLATAGLTVNAQRP